VELNRNLFIPKGEMEREQVVNRHERCWVHIAMTCQERPEVDISLVALVKIVKFDYIEVLFGIIEFVLEVTDEGAILRRRVGFVPMWESMLAVEFSSFEGFVVNERQDFLLVDHCLDHSTPSFLVFVLTEEHVVHKVVECRIIQTLNNAVNLRFKCSVQLWVSCPSHCIGIHDMGQISC